MIRIDLASGDGHTVYATSASSTPQITSFAADRSDVYRVDNGNVLEISN